MNDAENSKGQSGGVNISGGTVAAGKIIGRDYFETSSAQLDQVFAPLMEAVSAAKPEQQKEATQNVEALKQEAAKGKDADDGVMAKLVDKLLELVPGTVSAIAGAFGTPLLAGVAGPVTKWVLSKAQGKS